MWRLYYELNASVQIHKHVPPPQCLFYILVTRSRNSRFHGCYLLRECGRIIVLSAVYLPSSFSSSSQERYITNKEVIIHQRSETLRLHTGTWFDTSSPAHQRDNKWEKASSASSFIDHFEFLKRKGVVIASFLEKLAIFCKL